MNMAGQTINDRLLAARHSLAGQGLAKSVCKATTEEMIGPKKKHLDYLVHCTNEPNVSIPHLANLLVERTQSGNWVVVYKSLLTVHHLLAYGNERFMQYLASSNSTFNLSNFLDKGGVQGTVGARIGYDMSPFIRRYAKYLNDKALSYRTVAFDFCKVKRGKEEGSLRTMNADKLLKTLPVLQAQLDGLLEFDCQSNDLTNGVINMCFMLLFRDLIRLFACYNDGIINLLEKYFDMNKKQCKDALDLYKKFLVRMDRVAEFLKVAENVGIDKGDIPDLTKAPSSLLEALEGHLATMEGRKGSAANTPTQSASHQHQHQQQNSNHNNHHQHHYQQQQQENNVKSAMYALSSTSSSFGTAAASGRFDAHGNGIDDAVRAQALAEEEAAMNQYRQTKVGSPGGGGAAAATNPFLSSPVASQPAANIVDLFGGAASTAQIGGYATQSAASNASASSSAQAATTTTTKASEDLLQLGNPFADMFGGAAPAQSVQLGGGGADASAAGSNGLWSMKGTDASFVSDSNFSNVFGVTEPAGFDALGDVLKPAGFGGGMSAMSAAAAAYHSATGQANNTDHNLIGTTIGMQQQQQQHAAQPAANAKVLTGDLDSSLASLAENLTINKSASSQVKGVQWNSPKNAAKPASWTPQPMAATTGAGYRPMAQGLTIRPAPSTLQHPNMQSSFSNILPIMSQQQPGMPPMRPPPMAMQPQPAQQQAGGQAAAAAAGAPTDQNGKQFQLDPFGAF